MTEVRSEFLVCKDTISIPMQSKTEEWTTDDILEAYEESGKCYRGEIVMCRDEETEDIDECDWCFDDEKKSLTTQVVEEDGNIFLCAEVLSIIQTYWTTDEDGKVVCDKEAVVHSRYAKPHLLGRWDSRNAEWEVHQDITIPAYYDVRFDGGVSDDGKAVNFMSVDIGGVTFYAETPPIPDGENPDEYGYEDLKTEIILQAKLKGVGPEVLKFWWD